MSKYCFSVKSVTKMSQFNTSHGYDVICQTSYRNYLDHKMVEKIQRRGYMVIILVNVDLLTTLSLTLCKLEPILICLTSPFVEEGRLIANISLILLFHIQMSYAKR